MVTGLLALDFFSFFPFFSFFSELSLRICHAGRKRMVKPFAPIAEKLSVNFCVIASIAVRIPINEAIPNAMMATVIPVRNRLPLIVLKESDKMSRNFITKFKESGIESGILVMYQFEMFEPR